MQKNLRGFHLKTLHFTAQTQPRHNISLLTKPSEVAATTVVGYMNVNNAKIDGENASRYTVGGSSFISIGTTGYRLKDFKIVGGSGNKDQISFIQPDVAKIDNEKSYYWYNGSATVDPCWLYAVKAGSHKANDKVPQSELEEVIPAGSGFMCNFQTAAATLQYSGEVNLGTDDGTGKKVINCPRASRYTFIVNPLPYDVPLSKIKIVGGSGTKDQLSFFQSGSAKVDNERLFYWYNGSATVDPCWLYAVKTSSHKANDKVTTEYILHAGEGLLFNSQTAGARVQFEAPEIK